MVRAVIMIVLFLIGCADSEFNSLRNFEKSETVGIIGGKKIYADSPISTFTVYVDIKKYHQGSLVSRTGCSGVVIAPTVVLTSAHCYNDHDSIAFDTVDTLVVFDVSSKDPLSSRSLKVKNVVFNPKYVPAKNNWSEDIAILNLPKEVPAPYEPVSILNDFSVIQKGTKIVLAGYGISSEVPKIQSDHLKSLETQIDEVLKYAFASLSSDENSSCYGDSGGPALIFKDGRYQLFGTVTAGGGVVDSGKDCNFFNMYTRLDHLSEFLAPYLKKQ
ncbi:S1 family peptidase [Bdellovibrio reynosensis]|uniref:Trypsin-like serine protease n=1 Tax=Bdellovibrio reynosensis TaxID=2835041 RepID=A0ABY4C8T3_9BACT|nr:trypsin-like serine protease [Bdellovibrio reynosensis]UOF01402.1 trypsin-like serine protease [Bdellovibrio reynosensis]